MNNQRQLCPTLASIMAGPILGVIGVAALTVAYNVGLIDAFTFWLIRLLGTW